jgi:hypothetical protein
VEDLSQRLAFTVPSSAELHDARSAEMVLLEPAPDAGRNRGDLESAMDLTLLRT